MARGVDGRPASTTTSAHGQIIGMLASIEAFIVVLVAIAVGRVFEIGKDE